MLIIWRILSKGYSLNPLWSCKWREVWVMRNGTFNLSFLSQNFLLPFSPHFLRGIYGTTSRTRPTNFLAKPSSHWKGSRVMTSSLTPPAGELSSEKRLQVIRFIWIFSGMGLDGWRVMFPSWTDNGDYKGTERDKQWNSSERPNLRQGLNALFHNLPFHLPFPNKLGKRNGDTKGDLGLITILYDTLPTIFQLYNKTDLSRMGKRAFNLRNCLSSRTRVRPRPQL